MPANGPNPFIHVLGFGREAKNGDASNLTAWLASSGASTVNGQKIRDIMVWTYTCSQPNVLILRLLVKHDTDGYVMAKLLDTFYLRLHAMLGSIEIVALLISIGLCGNQSLKLSWPSSTCVEEASSKGITPASKRSRLEALISAQASA